MAAAMRGSDRIRRPTGICVCTPALDTVATHALVAAAPQEDRAGSAVGGTQLTWSCRAWHAKRRRRRGGGACAWSLRELCRPGVHPLWRAVQRKRIAPPVGEQAVYLCDAQAVRLHLSQPALQGLLVAVCACSRAGGQQQRAQGAEEGGGQEATHHMRAFRQVLCRARKVALHNVHANGLHGARPALLAFTAAAIAVPRGHR
mmetsp:Transcript_48947/g.123136  ORF Transcript_48947/g.123136 Transcript_48947/m.123136 type:complete len:202 (-) Transcript_48947:833-1438(-)